MRNVGRKWAGSVAGAHALLALAVLAITACTPSPPLNLIIFLEATPYPDINNRILQDYLFPLYQRLESTEKAVNLEIYAISDDTEGETALLQLTLQEGVKSEDDAAVLEQQFRALQGRLNRVYSTERGGYLVDVLGTVMLLDRFLGSTNSAPVEAIFVSDMVQQDRGYDFTDVKRGKSLEKCRAELEPRLAPYLPHRDLFSRAHIHLVPLNLQGMYRELPAQGTTLITATIRNKDEIQTFWIKDFFGTFLRAGKVTSHSGGMEPLLDGLDL